MDTKGRWEIEADHIKYNDQTMQYTATGNVVITQKQKRLAADKVIFNREKMTATAIGNVLFVSEGDRLTGRRLEMDLEAGTGTLYNGSVFTKEKNITITGDTIQKTGKNTYSIAKGLLTSCKIPDPDWSITARDIEVTLEGYGFASHTAMWVGNLPIFYLPWFMFPAKLERQTGLLIPQAGYSDKNGFEFNQPFFWAISENTDATFYYNHIENRGERLGFEYRYVLSENSKGTLMADWLDDSKIDEGTPEATEKWGYAGDNAIRPNHDRYWIRMKANQQLPWDAMARLDLDIVSDQDYLRDFSDGYMGYDPADSYFASEFGRDLDDENDPVRTNRLNINRIWTHHSLNADLVWYDDVIKRELRDENDTLQQLPKIQYNALKQPLTGDMHGSTVFGTLDSEYTYFYREEGLTGNRIDIHPRLYLPLRVEPYFTLEPSAGYRQTAWYIDGDRRYYGEERQRYKHRELYDLGAELSTDLNRVFEVERGRVEKINHVIIPKLSYDFIPETDQSEYPYFDSTDRIAAQNRITLSLTNLFTSKSAVPKAPGDKAEYRYNRFLRFFIEQTYDFRQRQDNEEPWLPLYAELDLTPAELITLRADAQYSHEEEQLISGNLSLNLHDRRGDKLKVEYRYSRDYNESLDLTAEIPVTDSVTLFSNYERNLKTHTDIEKGFGARYESQCWAVEFAYVDEENDYEYMVMVELYGLGQLGDRLER